MENAHTEKPDFEAIAKDVLGTSTSYGRCDAPIGSSLRSYYETEVNGFVKGCVYLQSQLKSKDQEMSQLIEIHHEQSKELEARIKELVEVLNAYNKALKFVRADDPAMDRPQPMFRVTHSGLFREKLEIALKQHESVIVKLQPNGD